MKLASLLPALIFAGQIVYTQIPDQDINPNNSGAAPTGMQIWRDRMYFVATDSAHGDELWCYDGVNPAHIVYDLNPGRGAGIGAFGVFQDNLYLYGNDGTGFDLYSYDGKNPPIQLTHKSGLPDKNVHEFVVALSRHSSDLDH